MARITDQTRSGSKRSSAGAVQADSGSKGTTSTSGPKRSTRSGAGSSAGNGAGNGVTTARSQRTATSFTAAATTPVTPRSTTANRGAIVHEISTRAKFDSLFGRGPTVTAGTPSELKFLIDRKTHQIYFIPPKWQFHYTFYKDVLNGPMDNATFDQRAYNRPDRDFIAGTVTAYDSYIDPKTGKQGALCFSLWPTDRFDASLLKEAHDAVQGGLKFLAPGQDLIFRPGGPIQDKLVAQQAKDLAADKIHVKTNLEISKGLTFMPLSQGEAVGKLVVIDKGQAMPALSRTDVAVFLGDVPPIAPPLAGIATTQVQTYNSHLGIKYRQDNTPYFYKAFTDAQIADLKKLNGKPVKIDTTGKDGTIVPATQAEADAYLKKIKPRQHLRLTPNLDEDRARPFSELAKMAVKNGRWDPKVLAAYGRKTLGVVMLAELKKEGKLNVNGPGEPEVVTPVEPMGIPASWYARFMREALDKNGQPLEQRLKTITSDPKFKDPDWKAAQLAAFRKEVEDAKVPPALLEAVKTQVAAPYLQTHPGDTSARFRSSAPVVEDSGSVKTKLPNMAGAFDSHSARWKKGANAAATLQNAAEDMAHTMQQVYASVFNDRAIAELEWNNVDMDPGSVAMAICVMPNEDNEKANGVVRVNPDLAGFFSVTAETQFGENLVTNPEQGATPDTLVDGNYDVLNGEVRQDIEYERLSNLKSSDPKRVHAYLDPEVSSLYKAMHVIRDSFAALEGKNPDDYVDECETKVLANGKVQIKQERPWVE